MHLKSENKNLFFESCEDTYFKPISLINPQIDSKSIWPQHSFPV